MVFFSLKYLFVMHCNGAFSGAGAPSWGIICTCKRRWRLKIDPIWVVFDFVKLKLFKNNWIRGGMAIA